MISFMILLIYVSHNMKTIITTLPIYDKLSKQCFERGKHAGGDTPTPIICPRHRLPSFQWLDGADGAASVTKIELCDKSYPGAEETVATNWTSNSGFDTFTNPSGLEINPAINAAGICSANSTSFNTIPGTQIRISGTLVRDTGVGTEPMVLLSGPVSQVLTVGVNNIILTAISDIVNAVTIYRNGATEYHFTGVSIKKIIGALDITSWFSSLPALAHDYFAYNGDTLNYLLPVGEYYLKITMNNGFIYYSEWFQVDCVYENLITNPDFLGNSYDTITISGISILSAINLAGSAELFSDTFAVTTGDVIKFITFLTKTSGQIPMVRIKNSSDNSVISNTVSLVEGLNFITLTVTDTATAELNLYNTDVANWSTSEILVIREYSTKYLTINFHNDCDLGDIYYHGGFTQTAYIDSEPMEPSFPIEEEGIKNGEGQFIRTFARQVKKYLLRTKEMPDYMVDVFNRMKLCDSIQLIDLVGDVHDVFNLEVEHEWLGTDKYYAKIDLTFDYNEAVVISGCCNNFT